MIDVQVPPLSPLLHRFRRLSYEHWLCSPTHFTHIDVMARIQEFFPTFWESLDHANFIASGSMTPLNTTERIHKYLDGAGIEPEPAVL